MSEQPKDLVEYRVLKPVFVNDTYVDPKAKQPLGAVRRKDGHVYVLAPKGLESDALKLAKGGAKEEPPPPSPPPTPPTPPPPPPAPPPDGGGSK